MARHAFWYQPLYYLCWSYVIPWTYTRDFDASRYSSTTVVTKNTLFPKHDYFRADKDYADIVRHGAMTSNQMLSWLEFWHKSIELVLLLVLT